MTPSAQELATRYDEISTDIERRKEDLKVLEQHKSTFGRQLNAIRDPVARLPLELSSQIFIHCLPTDSWHNPQPGQPGAHNVPMLFLNICAAWTKIAVSVPALWDTIEIHFPRADGFGRILDQWFKRAGSRPSHITLEGDMDRDVLACIWRYSHRIKLLDISIEYAGRGVLEEEFTALLGGTTPPKLPSLETLKILGGGDSNTTCSWLPILQLLSAAPNLVLFRLEDMAFSDNVDELDHEAVDLPNLRQLEYTGYRFRRGNSLACISAPDLQEFVVAPDAFVSYSDEVASLQRSSASLRELEVILDIDGDYGDFNWLKKGMPPLTALTRLEFYGYLPDLYEKLFKILKQSRVLPALQTLVIRSLELFMDEYDEQQSWWKSLVHGLWLRRKKLRTIRITVSHGTLSQKTKTLSRKLLDDGMDVYLGSEGREENFL